MAGFEYLEDRRLMAIDPIHPLVGGVLTFNGDFGVGTDEKLVIQSSSTPGTISFDDGNGLGSVSISGVNSVVFNAGGGKNEMVVINQDPSIFRPFAAASFDIQFNVTNDADFDVLRIAGGSAATILSGSYTVSSPTSGTISYATGTTPINIGFSGLSSTGLTPDRVDDVTIQAGPYTTNTSTGAESVTVKVGPVLDPVQSFTQGPVVIDGGDRDEHGTGNGVTNTAGWKYIQQIVTFVNSQSFIQSSFPGASGILAIGAKAGGAAGAKEAIDSAAAAAGITVTHVDGAANIAAVNFNLYKLIYVPSNAANTNGGITGPELDALILRRPAIQAYVRAGGGVVALTDADTDVPSMGGNFATRAFYGWLEIPDPFTIQDFGAGGIGNPADPLTLRKTQAAIDAGLSLTNAELSNGIPYHNSFTGPFPDFNGLDVFVLDRGPNGVADGQAGTGVGFDDRVIALGQGAINQTVGGGPTTQISGSAMTLINLGNKPALNLNALGGTDDILVDGSVLSLDGLLAPLTINGGGNGDSLSITDSADNTGLGDAVSVTSLATTGLAAFPITYSGIGPLSVQATQGADTLTLDFSAVGPSSVTILGGLGGDLFTGPSGYMRASTTIPINVHGGTAAATPGPGIPFNPFGEVVDKFNLDMTTTATGPAVTPIVIVDTNGGNASGGNTQLVRFTGMEDIDLLEGGVLTTTAIGDFYLRATDNADMITFINSAAAANPQFRVRVGSQIYPRNGGVYGPYAGTGTGGATGSANARIYAYGRGGNDTIEMYNLQLRAVFFGEAGNDTLTGGTKDDLLVGGAGIDRISSGTLGNEEVWGDDYDPANDPVENPAPANPSADPAILRRQKWALVTRVTDGNDNITTTNGADQAYGGGGTDTIRTAGGNDFLFGGEGNDNLDGQAGDDRVYGGGGNDTVNGGDGNDLVAGNAGNDFVYGNIGNDIVIGGVGVDSVNGNDGNDEMFGGRASRGGIDDSSLAAGDANDLAMLALLADWTPAGGGTLGTHEDDTDADTLWGGNGNDKFFCALTERGDFGASGSDF